MKNKAYYIIYITGFFLILLLPLAFINTDKDAVSLKENRPLTAFPDLFIYDDLNTNYTLVLEDYINDRIGFRDEMISFNGQLQYLVFGHMENGDRYRLGPGGEFNIIENDMLATYQNKNLFTNEELKEVIDSMNRLDAFVSSSGAQLYYVECYDKQSVYPEYFPDSVLKYGDISRTDQFMHALKSDTSIPVIDFMPLYLDNKESYEIYSPYGDPVHWTQRGAFMSYTMIMDTINQYNGGQFKILTEEDYDITMAEHGMRFYDGVFHSNISEDFVLKEPFAKLSDITSEYPDYTGPGDHYYTCSASGNDIKLMIIGNSFMVNYIADDLAESFGETLMIWSALNEDYTKWIESYKPDIVIYENAERYTDYDEIVSAINSSM